MRYYPFQRRVVPIVRGNDGKGKILAEGMFQKYTGMFFSSIIAVVPP
jgi:hypothetical protein